MLKQDFGTFVFLITSSPNLHTFEISKPCNWEKEDGSDVRLFFLKLAASMAIAALLWKCFGKNVT